jgi:hypothetical protein
VQDLQLVNKQILMIEFPVGFVGVVLPAIASQNTTLSVGEMLNARFSILSSRDCGELTPEYFIADIRGLMLVLAVVLECDIKNSLR